MNHLVIGIFRCSKNVLPYSFPVRNTLLLLTVSFPSALAKRFIVASKAFLYIHEVKWLEEDR